MTSDCQEDLGKLSEMRQKCPTVTKKKKGGSSVKRELWIAPKMVAELFILAPTTHATNPKHYNLNIQMQISEAFATKLINSSLHYSAKTCNILKLTVQYVCHRACM